MRKTAVELKVDHKVDKTIVYDGLGFILCRRTSRHLNGCHDGQDIGKIHEKRSVALRIMGSLLAYFLTRKPS